ncbi:hypothetical protein BDQ17DRAFT_1428941 [Cyathus striatus]|nr:hypothetical protein BDQ17DRAFT_1428941 [Cyathus striatus]
MEQLLIHQTTRTSFTIRKRSMGGSASWIDHTSFGGQATEVGYVSGASGKGVVFGLKGTDSVTTTLWAWSPSIPAMDMRHYDTAAHGLELAYEVLDDPDPTSLGIGCSYEITLYGYVDIPECEIKSDILLIKSSCQSGAYKVGLLSSLDLEVRRPLEALRTKIAGMKYSVFLPVLIIIYSFAIISTVFRLIYRARFKKLWWDDFWAAFSLMNAILLFAAYVRLSFGYSVIWLASYPAVMITSRLALWGARLSVAVTIVRVIATGKSLVVSKIVAVVFGMLAIALVVQKMVLCRNPGVNFLCSAKANVNGYTDLAATFFSDFWLIGAPAYLLWKMNLKKRFHRLLQAIFACEMLVLVTSIVHCVYIVKNDLRAQGVLSHFKVTISLIVCNLLCLVTYIYRLSQNGQERSEDSTTSAPSRQPNSRSYTTTSHIASTEQSTVQTQLSPLTSVFLSSRSHQSVPSQTGFHHESEPGITERQWSSIGVTRFASSV